MAAQGWNFDAATMQLQPQVSLKAGFTSSSGQGDPCDPVATGGYLGADNQLIPRRASPARAQARNCSGVMAMRAFSIAWLRSAPIARN